MLTQKLTKRQQAKANKLFACKGTKNAYCDETNTNRMALWRMTTGKAVNTEHITKLITFLNKSNS